MSGFVLALPFYYGKKQQYIPFILKRFLRIYIPYLISILLAFLLFALFGKGGINELGGWFSEKWTGSFELSNFISHIFLIGNYETTNVNPVVWTLIHEMRISIIFPVILWITFKFKPIKVLLLAAFLSIVSGYSSVYGINESLGFHTSYLDTLHYSFMFLIGALLAKNIKTLITHFQKLTKMRKIYENYEYECFNNIFKKIFRN
ncbi:acyltransferase family protein [Halobacillus halophilus DSM 2266]|uniref:Acyltransferase family protein n=1 Tax=Halobacillus halophilus (strain ATCC 35676 / DSM 2266 / JCM 20832 / KCTC 3685 / LMG 17431 / NBRC 102448 / NCIMB 2269) TaxID=866895 RepID=I0JRI7_HALH3|nr:acyltransferase family protein [Halobacillus halophilus]CCG46758.1 acyltransferase family protein [Halobacillus halophilus DSM 2266]